MGELVWGVKERITPKLLPSLLGLNQIDEDLRKLTTLAVKQVGGLGPRDPVEQVDKNLGSITRSLCTPGGVLEGERGGCSAT